jgi:hypothetical protein
MVTRILLLNNPKIIHLAGVSLNIAIEYTLIWWGGRLTSVILTTWGGKGWEHCG